MGDITAIQLIKSKCKEIDITFEDVEKKLGLAPGYISKIEEAIWGSREAELIKIANALWIDPDALIISSGSIPTRITDFIGTNPACIGLLKSYIARLESRNAPAPIKSKKKVK